MITERPVGNHNTFKVRWDVVAKMRRCLFQLRKALVYSLRL